MFNSDTGSQRERKVGSKRSPEASHCGGVDLADQRVRSYQRNTKTYVWYMKLFFYFLEVAIMNAYLLERKSPHHNPPVTQKARLMLPFRRELITKLIGGHVEKATEQPIGAR